EADADLRDEYWQLGDSGHALRGAVPGDVAAACGRGAAARAAMESTDRVSDGIVLRLRDVHLRRGTRAVLTGVSFDVARGALVAVMGPSGSGKTTVLRTIAGLESFDAGRIAVDEVTLDGGAPIPAPTLRQLRRKVGFVFQFHHLFDHLTALKNVWLAPVHAHG